MGSKEQNKKRLLAPILLVLLGMLPESLSFAASIYSCQASANRCIVQLEEGVVGDRIKVLDDKARPIAQGRIVRRKGPYAVISISDASQRIRKGYPVLVDIENRSNSLQWAASFSNNKD